jgi:hypothetical protein
MVLQLPVCWQHACNQNSSLKLKLPAQGTWRSVEAWAGSPPKTAVMSSRTIKGGWWMYSNAMRTVQQETSKRISLTGFSWTCPHHCDWTSHSSRCRHGVSCTLSLEHFRWPLIPLTWMACNLLDSRVISLPVYPLLFSCYRKGCMSITELFEFWSTRSVPQVFAIDGISRHSLLNLVEFKIAPHYSGRFFESNAHGLPRQSENAPNTSKLSVSLTIISLEPEASFWYTRLALPGSAADKV